MVPKLALWTEVKHYYYFLEYASVDAEINSTLLAPKYLIENKVNNKIC